MEEAEKLKVSTTAADKDFSASKAQIQRRLGDLDAKIAAIQAQLTELETERSRLAEQTEEDLLERYDRLFASKGDIAIVPLEHEVCTGCHMKITTQTAVRVRGEKEVVSCEQCGRILYLPQ